MSQALVRDRRPEPTRRPPTLRLPPFAEWTREGHVKLQADAPFATVSRAVLLTLLRPFLAQVRFDLDYYRRANPDLAEAEARGELRDLHEHYLEFGYFENRLPCEVEVDGAFYAKEYADVAAGILARSVPSAQWHFDNFGFKEGRLPRRGWSFAALLAR